MIFPAQLAEPENADKKVAYSRLQDYAGQASALAKKARVALYLGDEASAKEAESRWEQLVCDHDFDG